MTTRAQQILALYEERKTTLKDILADVKELVLSNEKPRDDAAFTQAVIDELTRQYQSATGSMSGLYRALANMVAKAAKAGDLLPMEEAHDFEAFYEAYGQ